MHFRIYGQQNKKKMLVLNVQKGMTAEQEWEANHDPSLSSIYLHPSHGENR